MNILGLISQLIGIKTLRLTGFAVGFGLGLGVLMGDCVGLGFGYLGGVVVLAWPSVGFSKGFLSRSWWIEEGGVACGSPKGETKKKREMRREKKKS